MPTNIPASRRKLIERIAAAARRSQLRAVDPAQFARDYFHGVGEGDLGQHTVTELARRALAHQRLARTRAPNETVVRVFNPDAERDGFSSTHTVVQVTTEDMPFLVDSVRIVFDRHGLAIHFMAHPILRVRRDGRGRLRGLAASAADIDGTAESWQHIEVDRVADAQLLAKLQHEITAALDDVRAAYRDWKPMRQHALACAKELESTPSPVAKSEAQESATLLRWLENNHFTFLGYGAYRLRRGRSADELEPVPGTALGILRRRARRETLHGDMQLHARAVEDIYITKSSEVAAVHRASYLDHIGVKTFDRRGRVSGERRFVGLFTSTVYSRSPRDIPLLRHKIQRVIDHFGLAPNTHDAKAVLHVLESYPRDELFHVSTAELIRIVRGWVNLYERRRVRLFLRHDPIGRFYSCLIFVPRDRYNTQVRERIEHIVRRELHASAVEAQVQLSESTLARLHIVARVEARSARPDAEALEQLIADATRTWDDRMRSAAIARCGEPAGDALARRYENAFPAAYEEDVSPEDALADIEQLERVRTNPDAFPLRLVASQGGTLHLRLFRSAAPITLSDALPVLENMGFTVLSERPYRIAISGARLIWLQDFEMQPREPVAAPTAAGSRRKPIVSAHLHEAFATRFMEAFAQIWRGTVENDGFNRLILVAQLSWREAMVLRAYCRYLLQTGIAFSQPYMEQVLASNASIATLLWQLFDAQFNSAREERKREHERIATRLQKALDAVSSLDEDRILRRFANAIHSSVRTNYFQLQTDSEPKSYFAIKFDARRMLELPQPRPTAEIFVYSPRVEGVHLRMGKVARGGIRWSDRREDFRTEVLGLMKAQNVKNTLIVPVGAKGGFVVKRLPQQASREDVQREVVACYRSFISGLLDLTDNLVKDRIVPPADIVRLDDDDPYLVVAADKGTATFSDIANRVAGDYGFWLGDAFASGGSAGYDHKKIGITARGAWECVKRHFRELGTDIQREDFTAIGIGDMSGDVFGNGMLLSEHTRLLAAFDHRHIFLDPNPHTARSFSERRRLFALPRSSWDDYDREVISAGGGVFARTLKSIRLSPQAQALLGLPSNEATPAEVIRAILRMPADLLWNGGIGTYVKASHESHAEAGDRANDAVRVNGNELRCKVVGEGGNLGFSQRGRIEYAMQGGRLNTDFVDNSAGVDCSDHEVNIKILLNLACDRGLTRAQRDRLLAAMTDDVAALVLRDNYLQSQALSVTQMRAAEDFEDHVHLIRSLELGGTLDRALEFLPDAEAIAERAKARQGLTRPELAILLAYAKMGLYGRLIESDVPEDPYLSHELERYFPAQLTTRYRRLLPKHRLRREIIATATTNSLVNRMGPAFARRVQEDTGADAATVARAYTIAREMFDIRAVWTRVEQLDNKVAANLQYEMLRETTDLLEFCAYWLIRRHARALAIEAQVSRLQPQLLQLADALPRVLTGLDRERREATLERYRTAQVPEALSVRVAALKVLHAGPDLVELATQVRRPIVDVARVYFDLGSALSLDWLRTEIESLPVAGHWQGVARASLRDEIYSLQRALCQQALAKRGVRNPVQTWMQQRGSSIAYVQQTMADLRKLAQRDFAALSVALQSVRRVTEGNG
ncbi:MAG: NAD-glutamate dehydrogenase [Steroidobacteraceae bacterium]